MANLDKFSGYDYVTAQVHGYQDRQRLRQYQQDRQLLRQAQTEIEREAEAKAELERFEMNRRIDADRKVAQREMACIGKQSLREGRAEARSSLERQPTAKDVIDYHARSNREAIGNERVGRHAVDDRCAEEQSRSM